MDKKLVIRIFCIILAAILALGLIVPAVSAAEKDLRIEVVAITEDGDEKTVELEIENNTQNEIAFGFAGASQVIVTTSEGVYYGSLRGEVSKGTHQKEVTIECPGRVMKIELTDVHSLDDRGLPEITMDEIVIFDRNGNQDFYSGNFSQASNKNSRQDAFDDAFDFVEVMFIIVPVLMVVMVAVIIISAIRTAKKNRQAAQQFRPFAAPGVQQEQMHNMAMNMHNQAHQQAMNMHNQAVTNHQNMVDNQFMQQSAMPMDMGGFNPPPPPPPTGF